MGKKKEIYTIKAECTNCGKSNITLEIPLRETVRDYLRFRGCEICGCKTLRKIEQPIFAYKVYERPFTPKDSWEIIDGYRSNIRRCPNCGRLYTSEEIHICHS